jgi:hypothetical protein
VSLEKVRAGWDGDIRIHVRVATIAATTKDG